MIGEVFRLLFPDKCLLCGGVLGRGELDLCGRCRASTPEFVREERRIRHVSAWTALWYYEGTVRESILGFKFRSKRSRAAGYGRMLAMRILRDLPQADLIVGVPISAKRRKERGYDQVELLAKAVSRELGVPDVHALEKHRDNRANSSLESAGERWANVKDVYRVTDPGQIAGRRVLLLDDVITTGATMSECARTLREAGAADVMCAAIAAGRDRKTGGNSAGS